MVAGHTRLGSRACCHTYFFLAVDNYTSSMPNSVGASINHVLTSHLLFFFATMVSGYWILRHRGQNILLFGWQLFLLWLVGLAISLTLMAGSTLADFLFATLISNSSDAQNASYTPGLSIGLNLVFLGYFRSISIFLSDSLHVLLSSLGFDVSKRVLEIVLPQASLFYTFQAIAYMVDNLLWPDPPQQKPDRICAVHQFFPLDCWTNSTPGPPLASSRSLVLLEPTQFSNGLMLILTGLFRKCVIADQCALIANAAFQALWAPSILER